LRRVGGVEHHQLGAIGRNPQDQAHHFGRQRTAAHAQQYHAVERASRFGGKGAQASELGGHRLGQVEPAQAVLDLGDGLGVGAPQRAVAIPYAAGRAQRF